MDQAGNEERPQARGSLAGSEDALITPHATRRTSNSRALKVAGLTTLACLLVASQVFTAYMVYGQKQQINSLQRDSEKMSKQLTRSSPAMSRVRIPMNSMPLLMDFTLDDSKDTTAKTFNLEDKSESSTSLPAMTKCQTQAKPIPGRFGAYQPQCDEQGRYLPAQCWPSIGFCWCVDKEGTPIPGTNVRGHPDCPKGVRKSMVTSRLIGTDGQ